jgi:protein-S-isoprenylcysteine O-methyltransferase Ste14
MPYRSVPLFFLFIAIRLYFTRIKYKRKVEAEVNRYVKYIALGPFFLWLSIILLLILPVNTPLKAFNLPINDALVVFGEIMIAISILLLYWGHKTIGNQWPVAKNMENYKLITTGPYKYVRHPIYLSFFLFVIGKSMVFANLLLLVIIPSLIVLYRHTLIEEKRLAKKFGKSYLEYMTRTGRFVPYLV